VSAVLDLPRALGGFLDQLVSVLDQRICRIWMWLATDEVATKQEAAAWLRGRVREKLEASR